MQEEVMRRIGGFEHEAVTECGHSVTKSQARRYSLSTFFVLSVV